MGIQLSCRDDLESLAYMLIYLLNGRLPWQGLRANSISEKCAAVRELKANTSIEEL